ncbi:hypothetical protein NPIL_187141 [Nephila pilipes]|uniref:Uncharacterized protein n=1 Tax=Nephila pilipes TaxID=299642 RepID=A0A8X6PAC6_NEPPI|nr:hypothetical protein NPIL_187141 [Nephila pilipes]
MDSVQQFTPCGWSRELMDWTNLLRWNTDESFLGGPFGYVPYRNLERMRVGVLTLDYDLSGVLYARYIRNNEATIFSDANAKQKLANGHGRQQTKTERKQELGEKDVGLKMPTPF